MSTTSCTHIPSALCQHSCTENMMFCMEYFTSSTTDIPHQLSNSELKHQNEIGLRCESKCRLVICINWMQSELQCSAVSVRLGSGAELTNRSVEVKPSAAALLQQNNVREKYRIHETMELFKTSSNANQCLWAPPMSYHGD